jgi:hypothetical protein
VEVFVRSATLKHHFDVILVFSQIWWVLFHVDHGTSVHEWVIRDSLRGIELDTLVSVERSGELVTVIDAENSAVEVDVATNVEVFPVVSLDATGLGYEMSLKENALGNTGVSNFGFEDVSGVIFKVVVDGALAKAVVFVCVFNDGLLEVSGEIKNL